MHPDEPIPPPDAADASATPTPARRSRKKLATAPDQSAPSAIETEAISLPPAAEQQVEPSPLPPAEAEAVAIDDVLSGRFDAEADGADADSSPKRVLLPQPEQPKLHKVLAQAGLGSRLEMEQLILEGRISVNNSRRTSASASSSATRSRSTASPSSCASRRRRRACWPTTSRWARW